MEKGLSRERKPRDLGPSPAFCTEPFLKPVSPWVSSAVKMPAMLSNTATARINLQFPSLILCHGVESILFLIISFNLHSIPRRKGGLSISLFQIWKVRHRVVKFIVQWHLIQPHTLGQNYFNSDSFHTTASGSWWGKKDPGTESTRSPGSQSIALPIIHRVTAHDGWGSPGNSELS